MLAWHAAGRGNSDRETQQFRCLSPTSYDILKWWRQQTATFMKLPAWQHHFWLCWQQVFSQNEFFSVAPWPCRQCKEVITGLFQG